uniref:Uncharacterized protein n=1 Tax=Parascaris univalens TaxID=6257 RepID=A0A915CGV0_PARUN
MAQEVIDSMETMVAKAQANQGTQYLDVVQQTEEKELREDAMAVLRNAQMLKWTRFEYVCVRPPLTVVDWKKQCEERQRHNQNQRTVIPLIIRGHLEQCDLSAICATYR